MPEKNANHSKQDSSKSVERRVRQRGRSKCCENVTIDGKDYIVVTKAQLVALNILRGKTSRRCQRSTSREKSGNDVVDSDVSEYVCILFFGAEKQQWTKSDALALTRRSSAGSRANLKAKGHPHKAEWRLRHHRKGRLRRPACSCASIPLRSLACATKAELRVALHRHDRRVDERRRAEPSPTVSSFALATVSTKAFRSATAPPMPRKSRRH